MSNYFLLIGGIGGLIFGFLIQFASREPHSEKIINKFRVKEKSFLRKILPFREKENEPFLYLKIVPLLFHMVMFIIIFILYIIFWANPILLHSFLSSTACLIISLSLLILPMICLGIMHEL